MVVRGETHPPPIQRGPQCFGGSGHARLRASEDEVEVAIPELLGDNFACAACAKDHHHAVEVSQYHSVTRRQPAVQTEVN